MKVVLLDAYEEQWRLIDTEKATGLVDSGEAIFLGDGRYKGNKTRLMYRLTDEKRLPEEFARNRQRIKHLRTDEVGKFVRKTGKQSTSRKRKFHVS